MRAESGTVTSMVVAERPSPNARAHPYRGLSVQHVDEDPQPDFMREYLSGREVYRRTAITQTDAIVVCLRNNRVLWRPSASRRCVPLPLRTAAGTPSSPGLARNTAASPYHTAITQTDH